MIGGQGTELGEIDKWSNPGGRHPGNSLGLLLTAQQQETVGSTAEGSFDQAYRRSHHVHRCGSGPFALRLMDNRYLQTHEPAGDSGNGGVGMDNAYSAFIDQRRKTTDEGGLPETEVSQMATESVDRGQDTGDGRLQTVEQAHI